MGENPPRHRGCLTGITENAVCISKGNMAGGAAGLKGRSQLGIMFGNMRFIFVVVAVNRAAKKGTVSLTDKNSLGSSVSRSGTFMDSSTAWMKVFRSWPTPIRRIFAPIFSSRPQHPSGLQGVSTVSSPAMYSFAFFHRQQCCEWDEASGQHQDVCGTDLSEALHRKTYFEDQNAAVRSHLGPGVGGHHEKPI